MEDTAVHPTVPGASPGAGAAFDAFISYRRSDGIVFARRLRRRLLDFRIPADLRGDGAPDRLNIYLDTIYERASEDFFARSIQPALKHSKFLIVVATPATLLPHANGGPNWVAREIEYFRTLPHGDCIAVALTDGDYARALPASLDTHLPQIERVDIAKIQAFQPLRGDETILPFIATLYNVPPERMPDLLREEAKNRSKKLLAATGVAAGIILILTAFLVVALYQRSQAQQSALNERIARREAETQQQRAESERARAETERNRALERENEARARQLAAESESLLATNSAITWSDQPSVPVENAVLVAIESMRRLPMVENDRALRKAARVMPLVGIKTSGTGRGDAVEAIDVSPDHRFMAIAAADDSVRLHDTQTGREVWRARQVAANDVRFSPDGQHLAIAGGNPDANVFAQLLRVKDGTVAMGFEHRGRVYNVAFSSDGKRLATASYDHEARVFDVASGARLAHLVGDGPVLRVAISADGQFVAAAGDDRTARVLRVADGQETVLFTNDGPVDQIGISPDGRYVAVAGWGRTNAAVLLDRDSGKEIARWRHNAKVSALAFSPDGRYVATGSIDNTARVFKMPSGEELSRLTHGGTVTALAFSGDGQRLATASIDHTARLFDVETGLETYRFPHRANVNVVALSADARYLAAGDEDGWAQLFDVSADLDIGYERGVHELVVSPNGTLVASARIDGGAVTIEDGVTGARVRQLPFKGRVNALAFSLDSRRLAVGGDDKAHLFDVSSGTEIAQFDLDGPVTALAFSPDGDRLLAARWDHQLQLFDARKRAPIWTRSNDVKQVCAVAVAMSGRTAAVGLTEGDVQVLDIETGAEVMRLTGSRHGCLLALAPDGQFVAVGNDKTLQVFDRANGRLAWRTDDPWSISSVAFSLDGSKVATGGHDSVRIFRVDDGTQTADVALAGIIESLHYGRQLTTASMGERTTRAIRHLVDPSELVANACARVTRNLDAEDWKRYVGREPYRRTCPNIGAPADSDDAER